MTGDYLIETDDVLDALADYPSESFHGCLSDPPYGINFMGKRWDHGVPSTKVWREVYRVMKPGAYLLAFGGTRTFHRLVCNIEDAGFAIRDTIMWLYGNGFPKSHDISKGIDKRGGVIPDRSEFARELVRAKAQSGLRIVDLNEALGNSNSNVWSHFVGDIQPLLPSLEQFGKLCEVLDIDSRWRDWFLEQAEREVVGRRVTGAAMTNQPGSGGTNFGSGTNTVDVTVANTELAQQWTGYGTALKPAHEPIVIAMKPIDGTFAANAVKHGCGGLNIDECRVAYEGGQDKAESQIKNQHKQTSKPLNAMFRTVVNTGDYSPTGRWPANIIHDGSDEVMGEFPHVKTGKLEPYHLIKHSKNLAMSGDGYERHPSQSFGGFEGSASRFFYTAKVSRNERHLGDIDCRHPTLKPIRLTTYLAALIRPPTHIISDLLVPYSGAGSEVIGALKAGWSFVYGIDNSFESCAWAEARIFAAMDATEFDWKPVKRKDTKPTPSLTPSNITLDVITDMMRVVD